MARRDSAAYLQTGRPCPRVRNKRGEVIFKPWRRWKTYSVKPATPRNGIRAQTGYYSIAGRPVTPIESKGVAPASVLMKSGMAPQASTKTRVLRGVRTSLSPSRRFCELNDAASILLQAYWLSDA